MLLALVLLLFAFSLSAQNRIVQYEYWFNDDVGSKMVVPVSPSATLTFQGEIDVSTASPGFNFLHLRFTDNEGAVSPVVQKLFHNAGAANGGVQDIAALEYWFWQDDGNRKTAVVSGGDISRLLDLGDLPEGLVLLNVRFSDQAGRWSPVYQKFFHNAGASAGGIHDIAALEYWFWQEDGNRQTVSVGGGGSVSEVLDLGDLPDGFVLLNMRFSDHAGRWSPVKSLMVFKGGQTELDENLVKAYRHWGGDETASADTVSLEVPVKLAEIGFVAQFGRGSKESYSIQFQDEAGFWSPVYTETFQPVAAFETYRSMNSFTFQNTSVFAGKFSWTFGDGGRSNEVHPVHTYLQPGEYEVCLIAENSVGKDTLCAYVTIGGIREVVARRGGNSGSASVYIYGGGLSVDSEVWLAREGESDIVPMEISNPYVDALLATFDLRGAATGVWSVHVKTPQNADYVLENAYTIEQGNAPEPYVYLAGRNQVLFSRWQTYAIKFGNKGNVDAAGVPLWLVVSDVDGIEMDLLDIEVEWPAYAVEQGYDAALSELPFFFETDLVDGRSYKAIVYPFYIPLIPAGVHDEAKFRIKSPVDFTLDVWINDPYFDDAEEEKAFNVQLAQCLVSILGEAVFDASLGAIPVVGCVHSIGKLVYNPYESWRPKKKQSWGSWLWNAVVTAVDCGINLSGAGAVAKAVGIIAVNQKNYQDAMKHCREKLDPNYHHTKEVNTVASFDPNEMVGPTGYTRQHYTMNNRSYPYTIYFENLKTATAPAQEVVVTDTLDASLFDLSSFSFGTVSWQDDHYTPLPGLKEFSYETQLGSGNPNTLRINARFDEQTGVAYWQLITLDPATMDLTEDPMGGFLPPNHNAPEGEGSVQFDVNLKEDLPDGMVITNAAEIIFDLNKPIVTNTYLNHIDITPPASRLTAIHYSPDNRNLYAILTSAEDTGSGVRNLRIYASVNGGDFDYMFSTSDDMFFMELLPDSVYRFFSLAVDSVGNMEPMKTVYEVSTVDATVSVPDQGLPSQLESIRIGPNPVGDYLNIRYMSEKEGPFSVIFYNTLGVPVYVHAGQQMPAGENGLSLDVGRIPPGVYLIKIQYPGMTVHKKMLISR